ncbi:hypothetical protein SCFA_450028 [anaerobic digester metagenome]|uniref:Uncharacterized protein n=1 Tax=anaerobic digester metagenome TaxID=1263854 RepID=A0A485M300_9ZZZZ
MIRKNRRYSKMGNIETYEQGLAYAFRVIARRAVSTFELKKNSSARG